MTFVEFEAAGSELCQRFQEASPIERRMLYVSFVESKMDPDEFFEGTDESFSTVRRWMEEIAADEVIVAGNDTPEACYQAYEPAWLAKAAKV